MQSSLFTDVGYLLYERSLGATRWSILIEEHSREPFGRLAAIGYQIWEYSSSGFAYTHSASQPRSLPQFQVFVDDSI